MNGGFKSFITAPERDRLDVFLAASRRLGAALQNIEKDFWVCWTLNVLYHELPAGSPRLLFKGGTSLSKAHNLIRRFSEDIDITVFREDLRQAASIEEMEQLSGKKRRAKLDAIRDACRTWVAGPLLETLAGQIPEFVAHGGRIELDPNDPDGQTVLVWYPTIAGAVGYVRPAVRIECGAKSALDPHRDVVIRPYISDDIVNLDLSVPDVTAIEPARTFWDKIVIVHGLRRWHEIRGELRYDGERVSRHYYDLHCLLNSPVRVTIQDRIMSADCVRHAQMFFDRPDLDLDAARPGSFAIKPNDRMLEPLQRDYANTAPMIFGTAPTFDEIMVSVSEIDAAVNQIPREGEGR
jgi:hypothetical protein